MNRALIHVLPHLLEQRGHVLNEETVALIVDSSEHHVVLWCWSDMTKNNPLKQHLQPYLSSGLSIKLWNIIAASFGCTRLEINKYTYGERFRLPINKYVTACIGFIRL